MEEAGTQPAQNARVSENGFVVPAKLKSSSHAGLFFDSPGFSHASSRASYTSFCFGCLLFDAMQPFLSCFVCDMGVPQHLLSATRPPRKSGDFPGRGKRAAEI